MNKGNIVTDIIERTNVEEQLTLAKFAVDRAADSIYWINPDASFFYVNDAACKSLGYTRDELLSMHVYDIDPHVNKKTWQQHWELIKRDKYFHIESQHRARNGRIIDIDVQANYLEFEGKEYDCAIVRDITERKIIEKNVTTLHERNNALVKALGEIVYEWYPQIDKIFWEGNYTRILGYSEEEMGTTTQSWEMRICPDDLDKVLKEIQEATIQNRNFNVQYRYLHKDGNYRWMHDRGVINLDEYGQLERITGVFVDITEHKHAENALLESENKFSTAFMSNPDAITITSIETGRIIDINQGFEKLSGYVRNNIIGKTTLEIGGWNDPRDRDEIIKILKRKGQIKNHEVVFKSNSGECRTCQVSSNVITLNNEQCVISIIHDITERKQMENALQESKVKLQNILDSMFTFVGLFSIDGILLEANRAPLERASLSREQVIGKPFVETYWWSYSPLVQEKLRNAMQDAAQGKSIRYDELVRLGEDQYITIDFMVGPLYDSNGNIIQLTGSAVDITERKQAEILQTIEKNILSNIATGRSLKKILNEINTGIESLLPGSISSIMFLDKENKCLRHGSTPGLPETYIKAVDGIKIGPCVGSCGTAAYLDKRVIVSDITNDPLWKDFIDLASKHNLQSCWSNPVHSANGQVLGTFAIYYRKPTTPTSRDLELIDLMTHLAGIAIERDIAKQILLKSEETYRSIVDTTSEWIWESNLDGQLVYSNKSIKTILGYDVDEFLEKDVFQLIHEEDHTNLRQMLDKCIQGKKGWQQWILRWQHKNGDYRYLESNAVPIFNKDKIIGFRGSDRDVTERKIAENAIKSLQQQNEMILESAGEGIYGVDLEGRVTFINPAAAKMVGWNMDEMKGKVPHDLLHHTKADGSVYPSEECPIYSAFKDGKLRIVDDEVFWRKDGTSFPVEYTSTPIRDDNGSLCGAVVVFRDISSRKITENALQRSEEHLRFLYEENPSMYFTVASDGTVLSVNTFGAEELGYTVEELTGNSILSVFPDNEHASVRKYLQDCLKNFGQLREWEIQKVRKNGEKLWVKETARAVGTPDRGTAILLVCRDITERKQAEDRLRNKINKDEFIADFGRYILNQKNIANIFDFAVSGLAQILGVEYTKILELQPDGKTLILRSGYGWNKDLADCVDAGMNSQAGYTLLSKVPVIVKDLRTESRFTGPALLIDHAVVSGISTIIEGRKSPYGVLGVHSRQFKDFTQDDVSFVQTIANMLAEVVEYNLANHALQLKHRALTVLSQCNDALFHATDEMELLRVITNIITETEHYLLAAVAYVDHDTNKSMRIMAGAGQGIDYLKKIKVTWGDDPLGCGPWGTAVKTGKPYIANNLNSDHQFLPWLKSAKQFGFNSSITLPLIDQTRVFGVLSIYAKEINAFDESEVKLLEDLAGNLAFGISAQRAEVNRRYTQEQVQKSQRSLRNLATRLQAIREDERARIAREIHDELGQTLTGLKMDLSWVREHLPEDLGKVPARIDSMISLVDTKLDDTRKLAFRLRPAMLDDLGLEAAIECEVQDFAERADCAYKIHFKNGQLDRDKERDTAVFRILQEALTNIGRHAGATKINVALYTENSKLVLSVRDNGIGIKEKNIESFDSLGIIGMSERAGALHGKINITRIDNGGTQVLLKLPLTRA